jgi:hypothetical protein
MAFVVGRGLWRLYFVVIGVAVMAPTVGGAHNNSVAVMAPTVRRSLLGLLMAPEVPLIGVA